MNDINMAFSIYDKMFRLFQTRINGNYDENLTRKLLSPMLLFFNTIEKERCTDVLRQQIFDKVLKGSQIQWFHWTSTGDYAGMGEWREFSPLSVAKLNSALRDNKTFVNLTVGQRVYRIDFNDMTKRLLPDQQQQGFHSMHSSVPIYAKFNLGQDFNVEGVVQLQEELRTGHERHQQLIKGILVLLKTSNTRPFDNELAYNALTLLLRLISLSGMAQVFLNEGGIETLLQMRSIPSSTQPIANGTSPSLNTLATLILRHCIDSDDSVLQTAFEQMIIATCNGQPISMQEVTSRRHAMRTKRYQKDVKRVLRMLTPLAVRAPALYIDMAKQCMMIKQNEVLLKQQHGSAKSSGSSAVLNQVMQQIISELSQYDSIVETNKNSRLMQPSNLLKLIAEILRSYPTMAVAVFTEQSLGDQSVLSWIIERFLLSAPVNDLSDIAHWAKAVVSELVSNSTNQRITDQVIGDIKSLLMATGDLDNITTTAVEQSSASAKYADRVAILAKLTMHLRDSLQANVQHNANKQSGFVVKSIHKKDLANDFVKSVWKLPLHEKQGIDTVNVLLKLIEGIMTKNNGNFAAVSARSYFVPSFSYDTPFDEGMALSRAALGEMDGPPAIIDPLVSSTPRQEQNELTTVTIEREETDQADESVVEPVHEEVLDNFLVANQEANEEEVESEDESPHDSEEEDMDTGEELTQQGAAVHEGAMEDDHVSEAADANEHVLHSHMAADDDFEEVDDDDDDGEEEDEDETEVEGGGEMADFEDTLLDYMTDFSALAQQMQDIRRRIDLTNAVTIRPQELQQVFGHHVPNNVRALIGYHPRNGGAVLRIRAGARNFLDIERLTAFNAGQVGGLQNGTALNQLFSSLAAGYGQIGPRDASAEDRSLHCFMDRLAEWSRIVESQTMFVLGAMTSAYVTAAVEASAETTAATDGQEEKADAEKTDNTVQAEETQAEATDEQQHQQDEGENIADQMEVVAAPPTTSDEAPTSQETNENADQLDGPNLNAQQRNEVVPDGVDPAFLAALPEDMRQEVIRDHLLQQQLSQPETNTARTENELAPNERIAAIMGMEIPDGMDPAFLAALPDDIFHEVVRDHQRQQEMARQRRVQLQAQQQEATQAMMSHPHMHHRHFAMPRFLARSIRPVNTQRDIPSTSSTNASERTLQLLDQASINTLLVLYLLDQDKFDIARLQKLLKLVCSHPGTCDFTIWALLSMFDGLDKFKAMESNDAADGGKYQSGWINELRLQNVLNRHERILLVTPNSIHVNNQVRSVAAQRVLDTLAYLARSFARNFLPKQIRPTVGKTESPPPLNNFWNVVRSINGRHAENTKLMHEMVADSIEKSPLAQLFKLMDANLAKESRVVKDRVIRMIASLSQAIPSDFQEKMSGDSKLWLGDRLKEFTNALMCNCSDEALREGRLVLAEMFRAIPSESHAILRAVYESIENHGQQLNDRLSSIRQAAAGGEGLQQSLLNALKNVSGRESVPGKLLKSLETLQYLCNHLKKLDEQRKKAELTKKKGDSEKKEEGAVEAAQQQATTSSNATPARETDESTLVRKLVDELAPVWEELSNCLSLLEKVDDSQHAVLCLQNAAEAFFLSYSLVIPPQPAQVASSSPSNADASPHVSSPSTASAEELGRYQKEMFTFAERHRSVLNQILRGNTQNLEGSAFAILTHFPKLLDFDVKTKYFHKELKKMDERNRYRHEDIAIRVRRSHLFGDSFRELYRLRPNDWKARLYIIFEGEEGQDAGGLLREWYSVITREIFNPNYVLFITSPGDRVTYMINKSSYVNPEHLDYFRFVGRVIAKAIYDNKQLDCYFTRAFYKHILNKHVRYQDIESEDPDLFKSLVFLLDNAVEALGAELSFCVEVEEFGVRSTRQLIENGGKTAVTDANKQEYVHLMCQMKMTGSIRQQLNAFLEGFYEVIPKKLISIFNEQELELLISGLPDIDIDDLCANTEYKTYTRTSPQVQWFWRALKAFDAEDKAKFLQFVTGTSKVPLQGFAHLEGMNGVQKFTIQKDTRSNDRLPSAHTCFNQLDLPEYPDYETLHKMLLLASRECSEGFAFA